MKPLIRSVIENELVKTVRGLNSLTDRFEESFGDTDDAKMIIEHIGSPRVNKFLKDKFWELVTNGFSSEKVINHMVPLCVLYKQFTFRRAESFTALMVMMDNVTYNYDDNSKLRLLPGIINTLTGKEKAKDYIRLEKVLTSKEYVIPEDFVRKYVDACDVYITCFAKFSSNGRWVRTPFDLWSSIKFPMFLKLLEHFSVDIYHNNHIGVGEMVWKLETWMKPVIKKKVLSSK